MSEKGLVYLAQPYTHPDPAVMESRFQLGCRVAAELMRKGVLIFSPIAHTHPIAVAGELPRGWDFWERYDRGILAACSRVMVLLVDGWERSRGVAAEIAIARELGIPVEFYDPSGRGLDWWARETAKFTAAPDREPAEPESDGFDRVTYAGAARQL